MELSNTLEYINLTGVVIGLVAFRGPIHLCARVSEKRGDEEGVGCDSEECDRGVRAGVNTTLLFATLQVVGLPETVRTVIQLRKKTMRLCSCDTEER